MVKKRKKSRNNLLKNSSMYHSAQHKFCDSMKSTEEIVESVVKRLIDNVLIMRHYRIEKVVMNTEKGHVIPVRKPRVQQAVPRKYYKPVAKKIYCCVEGCPTRDSTEKVKYHTFPSSNYYNKMTVTNEFGWNIRIGRLEVWENSLQTKRSFRNKRVCYRHFLDTDYYYSARRKQYLLRRTAVPFRFSPPDRKKIVPVVKEEVIVKPDLSIIDSRCAVCLSDASFHNIYEFYNNITILKMLELCTGYEIDEQEQLLVPGICDICYEEVLRSYKYREKLIESQNTLIFEKKQEQSRKKDPFNCFDYFMGEVLDNITDYTNKKIRKLNNEAANVETCKEEIMALVGLLVLAAGSKKIDVNEKELVNWCSGLPNGLVMNYARITYLTDQITFYDIESNSKHSEKLLFTLFKGVVWDKFLDKCKQCERPNSTVTRIDFYLQSQTPYPFRHYVEPQENYIIKIISHFDYTNQTLLKVYPWFGQDPYQVEYMSNCEDITIIRGFEHLWSSFMFISQRSNTWSMILFYTMLNIALINSYAMHCLNATVVSEEVFLKKLVESLVRPWINKNKSTMDLFGQNTAPNITNTIKKIRFELLSEKEE